MENLKYLFKIVVAGEPGVGKTSLVRVYATGKFEKNYIPTLGVNILSKNISFKNVSVALAIWDLAGQGFMDEVRAQYYAGARAAIMVYDVTKEDTFARVVAWNEECKRFAQGNPIKIVVGNKVDLAPEREVVAEDGLRLAKEIGAEFFETSAMSGENVDRMFTSCAKKLLIGQLASLERKMSVLQGREGVPQSVEPIRKKMGEQST